MFSQAEKVFNQDLYYKRTVKYVGEPMTHLESIASSAVRSLFLLRPQFLFTVNMGNIFSHLLMMYHKVFIKHGFLSMKTIF